MKHEKRFSSKEDQQLVSHTESRSEQLLEFATPEEMLRHDAVHTPVPPAIGQRLRESLRENPPPGAQGWWRRWLGKS